MVCSALRKAAAHGDLAAMTLLDRIGADLNSRSGSGDTPLHRAAELGRQGSGALLLGAGAEVDVPNARATYA
jgi:ankyrin repeat protein